MDPNDLPKTTIGQAVMTRRFPEGSFIRITTGPKKGQIACILHYTHGTKVMVQMKPLGKGRHKNRMEIMWRSMEAISDLEVLAVAAL